MSTLSSLSLLSRTELSSSISEVGGKVAERDEALEMELGNLMNSASGIEKRS